MKKILITYILIISTLSIQAKNKDFIEIQTNEILSIINFLDTAVGAHSTSTSFKSYIDEKLNSSSEFKNILKEYSQIKLNYQYTIDGIPFSRHTYREVKDLLWIAASNAKNIDDFSSRIIGYLPHTSHVKFIKLIKQTKPIYEKLIWNKQRKNIKRIEKKIGKYTNKIEQLYEQISHFYGTNWDKSIPFKIALYPIPLAKGNTTAIPKGNTLIAGFLAENKNDYKGLIGIIIHEMCHVLYRAQPAKLQHQIDEWFTQSESEYSKFAYSYINEGLATALGNGWSYKQINGKEDTSEWYNNKVINKFAHVLYKPITNYMTQNKTIDQDFINNAIELFAQAFPDAINETAILFNEIQLFSNKGDEEGIDVISLKIHKYFQIRSMWFSSPIMAKESIESFNKQKTTKLFIIDKDNKNSIDTINTEFNTNINLDINKNFIHVFKDNNTKSMVVIINIHSLAMLDGVIKTLSSQEFLTLGTQWLEK